MISDSKRLFLGLELNAEARFALDCVRQTLQIQGVTGKFHAPALYHLTLAFLGNTPIDRIPDIQRLMDGISAAPFTLTLNSLGTFKSGTILWAGVKCCAALMDYQRELTQALTAAGFAVEEGEYRPHITLARQVKSVIPETVVPSTIFPVGHATLFESTRVEGALTYLPLYRSAFH